METKEIFLRGVKTSSVIDNWRAGGIHQKLTAIRKA